MVAIIAEYTFGCLMDGFSVAALLLCYLFCGGVTASRAIGSLHLGSDMQPQSSLQIPVYYSEVEIHHEDNGRQSGFRPLQQKIDIYNEFSSALKVMQDEFFELWIGRWPSTIDWTGAVMNTYISAALITMTKIANHSLLDENHTILDNEINHYFSQSVAYYFGEDSLAFRFQAHDDMLWLVLGWLESIKFINLHNRLLNHSILNLESSRPWYGKQFENAFSHRSRIFYDIPTNAWETKLCGGGLTWNPNLTPYKNTITNSLFLSAAISMYLYHPGDQNSCPFVLTQTGKPRSCQDDDYNGLPWTKAHDPAYLYAAIQAYDWLVAVNLTNTEGLFVDGYHISHISRNGTGVCDARNEMVYSYNQGVMLSGLRSLWESTGNITYLTDGHRLVRSVIRSTGWDVADTQSDDSPPFLRSSHGTLGRNGILSELCDPYGTCGQDAQTFKGIFYHHMALFCEPLPVLVPSIPGLTHKASRETAKLHRSSCIEYIPWLSRNAQAALQTKSKHGIMGGWWGAEEARVEGDAHGNLWQRDLPAGAIDYRNEDYVQQKSKKNEHLHSEKGARLMESSGDANDRGRGRTIESHASGLSVVRTLFELVTLRDNPHETQ